MRLPSLGAIADPDAAESVLGEGGEAGAGGLPGRAAVGGFEEAAVGSGEDAVLPRSLLRLPEYGVDMLGIARIESKVDGAGEFVLIQHLLPGLAAIEGTEDTALRVRPVGVAEDGDEEAVGIARIDQNGGDLLARRAGPGDARCWPASVDLYMPSPVDRSGRCRPSPEPT